MNENDIEIVIMNPERIPSVREKMFELFYERFIKEISNKQESNLKENNK